MGLVSVMHPCCVKPPETVKRRVDNMPQGIVAAGQIGMNARQITQPLLQFKCSVGDPDFEIGIESTQLLLGLRLFGQRLL
jgi:hypothetical protein